MLARRVPARSSPARARGRTSTSPGPAFLDAARGDYLSQPGGTGYGVRLIVELASRSSRELRPHRRAPARCAAPCASSPTRARRAGRRRARPRAPLPVRARRGAGRARADGHADPRGVRRRRRRHALVRDRDRGADADRLLRRDHGRRAHVARDDADPALRQRRAEAASGCPTSPRAASSPRSG